MNAIKISNIMTMQNYKKKEIRTFSNYLIEKCKVDISNINDLFDFITVKKLRNNLVKSYREASFVSNLIENLEIKYTDAHPFNEIQLLHYASICEELIQYISKTYHIINQNKSFKDKTEAFKSRGIIDGNLKDDLDDLWDNRNCIHISKAVNLNLKFLKKLTQDNDSLVVRLCTSLRIFTNIIPN